MLSPPEFTPKTPASKLADHAFSTAPWHETKSPNEGHIPPNDAGMAAATQKKARLEPG
jgi:hypothetical protein